MGIRERLAAGGPVLFDGAMGTLFAAAPGRAGLSCEQANLDRPTEIAALHRAYLEAGCSAIKTNTFSLGALFAQGEAAAGEKLIEAACGLALTAAAPYGAHVFADLGPVPEGAGADAGSVFCRQAEIFLRQGICCFLVETLSSDAGLPQLSAYLKERCPDAFLLVSFAVGADGISRDGLSGAALYRRSQALPGVDAVGFNCLSGPQHLLGFIRQLTLGEKPLSVMPNAGYPTVLGRRIVYQGEAGYFARQMGQIVQAGAQIVGGCCGTTPEHIAALAKELSRLPSVSVAPAPPQPQAPPEPQAESPFWDKLRAGQRVVAVELDPPKDDCVAPFLEGVGALRDAGADLITVADCPVGRPRADSCLLSCKIRRELGVEPLPHMTCRDRNLNAIKALLLGLSMEGVHNVLLVTGDPIPSADRDEVKSVFNFNSRKLARYVRSLNETVLRHPFHIFGALNLNARNFSRQLELALEKEENGVEAFLTQPVLSEAALENLRTARRALRGKLLGGVFPIVSEKSALFLNNEIAGICVAEEIVALYRGKDREEGEALAETVSLAVIDAISPYCDGLYLMTPFRRTGLMCRILAGARGRAQRAPTHMQDGAQ